MVACATASLRRTTVDNNHLTQQGSPTLEGTPPNPGVSGSAPGTLRTLSWSPIHKDVGTLDGGWFALASGAEGRALWYAGVGPVPPGIVPRHLTKDAFVALRDGERMGDGTIRWEGQRWSIADVGEGHRMVAHLVREGIPA